METQQRLNLNALEGNPSHYAKSAPVGEKIEQKTNCLVRLVRGFLQAIVHFFKLYRYNNRWDFLLLFVGVITSIGAGFGLPLFAVVAGQTIDAFDQTPQSLADEASRNKNYLLIIGFSMFAVGSISFSAWLYLGERISMKFREQYLKGLMKQEIQFFQGSDEQQIYERFEEHMKNIKQAAGLKAGALIYIAASFAIAGKIATSNGFFLSLIMIPTLPILGVSGFLFSIFVQLKYSKLMRLYQKAEQKVRQSLSFLRTVKQLNGQNHQVKLFQQYLKLVREKVIIYSILAGLGAGIFSLMQFLVYCLAFWLGSHCVEGTDNCGRLGPDQKYTPGDVILIFFAFFVRLDSMQQLFPALKRIYNGTSSYQKVNKIISRKPLVCCPFDKLKDPQIDFRTMKLGEIIKHMKTKAQKLKHRISSFKEKKPSQPQSPLISADKSNQIYQNLKIQFQNVTLFSKADTNKKILDDITFTIDKELICLNGEPQQKQAVLELILRLYDPDKGSILINGVDIRTLNLSHLRKKIGYLDKKTYIFETNIKENIVMNNKDITDEMIWTVLEELQIAETIKLLDDQLYSQVGFEGKKLSQRLKKKIILARILIKNPQILLFKEEYSFLSEDQQYKFYLNLHKFKQKKLLIYAGKNERIIKKADKIFVLSLGKIRAEGDFYSLQKFYQDEVTVIEQIAGQKKIISDHLYKSNLKSSKSIRQSDAIFVNEIETASQTSDASPQKMLLIQQQQHFNKYKETIHKRLFGYLKGSIFIYFLGFIVCLISGILYPVFTIFMSDILLDTFEFKKIEDQNSFIRQKINNPILFILWIGIASFFVNFFEVFIFSVIAQKMGEKLRLQTLRKTLKLPLNWFEASPLRTSFRMSQTIKLDPTIVQNLLTNFYSIIIKNSSSFVTGIIIALVYEWRSALLGIIVLPMMMLSGYLSVIFYRDQLNLEEKDYIDSAEIVTESILNMKAIHTEGCQQMVLQKYKRALEQPLRKAKKRVILCSMLFGMSQLLILISYTIMFYFGTMFYKDNSQITTLHLLTAIFAVIWSGWTSGANFIRLPARKSCEIAASNIFSLLDEVDEEENQVKEKSKLLREGIKGNIQFKDVTIRFEELGFYIDKVNFKIEQKNQIAILSTTNVDIKPIIDLLYRFQQPEEGTIFIDNQNIKDYEISYLRSSLGVIREEPVIFTGTLRQNIVYNKEETTETQIVEACTLTNVISIIDGKQIYQNAEKTSSQFQENVNIEWNGFETMLDHNMKIMSLSQKQRINMARVMLGQPKILLINDEVYSMRYFYENFYREAIQKIIKDRTSIFMPHHSENLEKANVIMVLERDKIIQVENYEELLKNKSLLKRIKRNYFNALRNI